MLGLKELKRLNDTWGRKPAPAQAPPDLQAEPFVIAVLDATTGRPRHYIDRVTRAVFYKLAFPRGLASFAEASAWCELNRHMLGLLPGQRLQVVERTHVYQGGQYVETDRWGGGALARGCEPAAEIIAEAVADDGSEPEGRLDRHGYYRRPDPVASPRIADEAGCRGASAGRR